MPVSAVEYSFEPARSGARADTAACGRGMVGIIAIGGGGRIDVKAASPPPAVSFNRDCIPPVVGSLHVMSGGTTRGDRAGSADGECSGLWDVSVGVDGGSWVYGSLCGCGEG